MNRLHITVLPLGLATILLLASHSLAQSVQEVRVRWDAYSAAAPQVTPQQAIPANILTLLERRRIAGSLPKQRNPEFSADQIAIQAVNAKGDVIDGQLIPDPRILRAEHPGPSGELSGQVLHHVSAEFLITLPDDPAIVELRLYQPRWTGTNFVLDPIGAIPLR